MANAAIPVLSELEDRVDDLESENQEKSKSLAVVFEKLESTAAQLDLAVSQLTESNKIIADSNGRLADKMEEIINLYISDTQRITKIESSLEKKDRKATLIRNTVYGLGISLASVFLTTIVEKLFTK